MGTTWIWIDRYNEQKNEADRLRAEVERLTGESMGNREDADFWKERAQYHLAERDAVRAELAVIRERIAGPVLVARYVTPAPGYGGPYVECEHPDGGVPSELRDLMCASTKLLRVHLLLADSDSVSGRV